VDETPLTGMAKIVVVGSLNMDVVAVAPRIPVAGETIIGDRFFTSPGGKGANQAYAAAKLGGSVAMLGRVGEDDFGREMRKNLASVGCLVETVRAMPGASGVALIYVAESGENSIVVVPGANHSLLPGDIFADGSAFDECTVVLLQLETPIETVIAAARFAKQRNARVILDPAPAPPSGLPPELLESVDILTPNETEAAILADSLDRQSPRTIILKLGERGCELRNDGKSICIPAIRVNAVDTTAAGDVFNAALAVALSEGAEIEAACRFAIKAAAVSVTRLGAQSSAPARSEVD
jgi:ribokinase